MIYARAHDQTVAEDYFTAMQRVERRLDIGPAPQKEVNSEDVKVQALCAASWPQTAVFQLIERLELPDLCSEERLGIASQLREAFGAVQERAP
jgi:hypothetical protein